MSRPARAAAATWTRTTSGSGRGRGSRPRTQGPARPTTTPRSASSSRSTAGRSPAGSTAHEVTAMKARELGRAASSSATGSRWSATCRGADTLARIVRVEPRTLDAAPHGRRQRPVRAGHRRERRPAGHRHRAGRPGAPAAADRPVPGRRLRRRAGPAALPDEVRPRVAETAARGLRRARRAARRDHTARTRSTSSRATCATGSACWSGTPASASRRWSTRSSPGAGRATGGVNAVTGRGRHTSSSAIALELPGGGWVIDTPGVRSFGLAHVDLTASSTPSPTWPRHRRLPAVVQPRRARVRPGRLGRRGAQRPARLASLRRLLRSRDAPDEDELQPVSSCG